MGVNGKKKLFANPSIQNIYAIAFIFFTNPLQIFTRFTTLSSFLKIECIPSCHSNQYCWIAAIWEDWNEKKTKVKEKWNLSELQQLSQVIRRRESDLLRNTTKGKERKKTTKLRIKETIWGVTCEETQKRRRRSKKQTVSKTRGRWHKKEEKTIMPLLLHLLPVTVNGDFSWVYMKLFATCLTVQILISLLLNSQTHPYLCIHFLYATKKFWNMISLRTTQMVFHQCETIACFEYTQFQYNYPSIICDS